MLALLGQGASVVIPRTTFAPGAQVTPRQQQIATLVAAGYTNGDIGLLLGISPRTVETHRDHLYARLGARGTADVTRYAIQQGWVTLA